MATTVNNPAPGDQLPPVQQPPAPPQADEETLRLRREVARQGQSIEEMKRRFTAPPAPVTAPVVAPDIKELNKQFFNNPVESAYALGRKAADDAIRATQQNSFDTLVDVARQSARGQNEFDQKVFDKFLPEIEAMVSQADPPFRTNVNLWKNCFAAVKGAHIDEIMAMKGQPVQPVDDSKRAPAVHISHEAGPGQSGPRAQQAPKGEELSADEKRVARRLGLSEDQYKQGKAHLEGQNDPETDPVGKSSWDEHITFDSREMRRKHRAAQKAKVA